MKRFLRFATIILCFSLIQTTVFGRTFPDVTDTKYQTAVSVLNSLNIMYGTENGNFEPERDISRAEMVTVLVRALGLEALTMPMSEKAENAYFADVPRDYWAVDDINLAYILRWANGDGFGYFRPDEPVTYAEAIKLIVVALGYGYVAESEGGYPFGYINRASRLRILRNVNVENDKNLSRGEAALLVYNSLEVEILEPTIYGDGRLEYVKQPGTTILEKHQKLEKGTGIVETTHETALFGESMLPKGRVVIDGITFQTGDTNAEEFLGYNVSYMFEDVDGVLILRHIEPKNNNILVLNDCDNNYTYSDFKYTYYLNKDRKSVYVNLSRYAYKIYNGKNISGLTDIEMTPENGEVILIDNNDDNVYDVVLINSYKNLFVASYNSDNDTIYSRDGKTVVLGDDVDYIFCDKEGEPWKLQQLVPGLLISVYESKDKKQYKIIAGTETIDGKVEEYTEDDYDSVVINEKSYLLSGDVYVPNNARLTIGSTGAFFLDVQGRIAAFIPENNDGFFGYLISANEATMVNDRPLVKMFKEDGEFEIIRLAKRVNIDGEVVNADRIYTTLGDGAEITSQVVKYAVNGDNEINLIDTVNKGSAEDNNSFHFSADIVGAYYRTTSRNLGTKINLLDSTVIFQIPTDVTNDKAFGVIKSGSLINGTVTYTCKAYSTTSDYIADVLVMPGGMASANFVDTSSVISVAVKMTVGIDNEGETIHNLHVLTGANAEILQIDNEEMLAIIDSENNGVVLGKVFRYALTNRGYVGNIQTLYNPYTKKFKAAGSFNSKFRVAIGDIYHKEDNNLVIMPITSPAGTDTWGGDFVRNDFTLASLDIAGLRELYVGTAFRVIVVDLSEKTVELKSMSSLMDYKSSGLSDLAIYQTRDLDPIALIAFR